MKKAILSFTAALLLQSWCSEISAQTLFTYGSDRVQKDEFLRAYNRNKSKVEDPEKALREYLDLYVKFKLKVKAAKVARIDTIPQLQYELQGFRSQVEENFLNDEKQLQLLVDEAHTRSQQDLHVIHFTASIHSKMSAADTQKIYAAFREISNELKKGNTNYDAVARQANKKFGTEITQRDLGFLTAFSVSYAIENILYALPNGGVSTPYRGKSALHLFKREASRPSPGKWTVAQILLSIPPDANEAGIQQVQQRADSIRTALSNGASFAELARRYSDDKLTYLTGGEMPEFGTGKFEKPFEDAVFALRSDGQLTPVFRTSFGFHIVKRIKQRAIPVDLSTDVYAQQLRQQVNQDTRVNSAKSRFLKDVLVKVNYKKNPAVRDAEWFRFADSIVANRAIKQYPFSKKVLFTLKAKKVMGNDWLHFVHDYKLNQDVYKGESDEELQEKYIQSAALEYYRNHLENYNPDFAYQIQEVAEGNMMFEIMDKKVWTAAANDSAGLRNQYNQNRSKYTWGESAAVLLFNCNSEKSAKEAITKLAEGKTWQQIAEESEGRIQSDSGRYEVAQLLLPGNAQLRDGLVTDPLVNENDNTASFLKVIRLYPANQPRSFDEARGLVINDYQQVLEDKWVAELRKQYPVQINEAVFRTLLK
jgi:peptidyl-prolyl cis-trans isomerase SurA